MGGLAEDAAEFRREDVFAGLARFRRFAEGAPLFEVTEIKGDRAMISFPESGEFAEVRVSDVLHSIQAD